MLFDILNSIVAITLNTMWNKRPGEVAQLVKGLSHNQEDMNLIFRNHLKKKKGWAWPHAFVIPELVGQRQVHAWGLLS